MARPAEAVKSPAEAAYALNCLCRHRKLGERAPGSVCTWTCSSVGRATRLHRVGRRFESGRVHHKLRIRTLDLLRTAKQLEGKVMSDDRVAIPEELAEALSQHEVAEKIFTTLPPSHQKEYLRWIGEARRAETRRRRAARAVEMMIDKHG